MSRRFHSPPRQSSPQPSYVPQHSSSTIQRLLESDKKHNDYSRIRCSPQFYPLTNMGRALRKRTLKKKPGSAFRKRTSVRKIK